jgi:arginine/lysine/ornithine decarboxylase
VTSAPLGIRKGAKLASALVVDQDRDRMSMAEFRRQYMANQVNAPKQGLTEALETARRRTDKDLANFDRAIQFRDRLRSDAESLPAPGGRKKTSTQR